MQMGRRLVRNIDADADTHTDTDTDAGTILTLILTLIVMSPLPVQIIPPGPNVSKFVATFPTFLNCLPQKGTTRASCPRVPRITTAGDYSTFMVHPRDTFGIINNKT